MQMNKSLTVKDDSENSFSNFKGNLDDAFKQLGIIQRGRCALGRTAKNIVREEKRSSEQKNLNSFKMLS